MRGFTNMHLDASDALESVIMRLFTLIACRKYCPVKRPTWYKHKKLLTV